MVKRSLLRFPSSLTFSKRVRDDPSSHEIWLRRSQTPGDTLVFGEFRCDRWCCFLCVIWVQESHLNSKKHLKKHNRYRQTLVPTAKAMSKTKATFSRLDMQHVRSQISRAVAGPNVLATHVKVKVEPMKKRLRRFTQQPTSICER